MWFKRIENIQGLENVAEWADVFTVSNTTLQRVVKMKWGHLRNAASKKLIPVMVCENRVPLALYSHQEGIPADHEGVVIGWAGSNTHAGDFHEMDIWKILYNLLEELPEVKVELIGQPPPKYLLDHPRVIIRPWVHISEYPARAATWNWDIVLAPLEDHKFNRSKSSIRMQEAGALHRPCLASSITPYDEFVAKGPKELRYMLCMSGWQWEEKLRELVASASLRKEIGEAMYQNVKENFNIDKSIPEWQSAIETAYYA
jgi:glycosyltransferase involved in cell wall biosynthesis